MIGVVRKQVHVCQRVCVSGEFTAGRAGLCLVHKVCVNVSISMCVSFRVDNYGIFD